MFTKELISFYRKISHQKLFFGINLAGLSIGIFIAILAFLYVQDEFKYDKHFTNTDDVYLLACNNGRERKMHRDQPAVFMDRILKAIPEIKNGIRIKWTDENMLINNIRMEANDFSYADADFFSFMGWKLVSGNPDKVLEAPMTLAISEKIAKQIYGEENPIGKIVNLGNKYDYTITGIFKDLPDQANIDVDFIASLSSWRIRSNSLLNQWGWHSSWIYLNIPQNNNKNEIEKKIATVWNNETTDEHCKGDYIKAYLQPFKDNYLKSGDITGQSDPMTYVISFSIIAFLILIISCFNFINLSLAVNDQSFSENQIKRILGADKSQLALHVLTEVFLYLTLAILFSSLLLKISLPVINTFLHKHIVFSLFNNLNLIIYMISLTAMLMMVCGLTTAFMIIKRINTKQNYAFQSKSLKAKGRIRNSLVTAQFTIGIILITCTITINQQLNLIQQHDTGFDKEQIIAIDNYEGNNERRYQIIKEALLKHPEIKAVSCGTNAPVDGIDNHGGATVVNDSNKKMEGCAFVAIDYNYLPLIGSKFVKGKNFDATNNDNNNQVIITESMANELQLKHPVGSFLTDMWNNKQREIIGVVKDIEYKTLHEPVLPIAFFYRHSNNINFCKKILIKLQSNDFPHTLSTIQKTWNDISPEYPIHYRFLDKIFNDNYKEDIRTGNLVGIMTVIAVFLSCMGLFALALFHINHRIKEIGIRKVSGAKIFEILILLNKDFAKRIVLAFVISTPITYYAMHIWLKNFAYKTNISWWFFALSGVLTFGIALLTISWQSWQAATRNPVEALKYE